MGSENHLIARNRVTKLPHMLETDASGNLYTNVGNNIAATQTILRAPISANTSGNNTIIAAVLGKSIKVLSILLNVAGDVDIRLESGAGGTALTGVMSMAADGNGLVWGAENYPILVTAAGALLNLELSANVQVSGAIVYYTE